MALKFVILLILGRVFKLQLADNLMFSFLLAQGGEFAFLLVSFALQTNALNLELCQSVDPGGRAFHGVDTGCHYSF